MLQIYSLALPAKNLLISPAPGKFPPLDSPLHQFFILSPPKGNSSRH